MVFNLLKKCILWVKNKLKVGIFTHVPPDKTLPGFYFHLLPPESGKLLLPLPEAVFFGKSVIPLSRKGGQETKKVP